MLILAVAALEVARRSENMVESGTGTLGTRAGSSVARTSTNNCMRVAISVARFSRVGLKRMYNGKVWRTPAFIVKEKIRKQGDGIDGLRPQEGSNRRKQWKRPAGCFWLEAQAKLC